MSRGLISSLALLQACEFVEPPPLPPATQRTLDLAHVALVNDFYDAVNLTLRSGETTGLDALVALDLIEHPARLRGLTGRAGLAQTVLTLRGTVPGLQIRVDDLQATGYDQVTARVRLVGDIHPRYLGLTLPMHTVGWPLVEIFRIEGEQIIERWRAEAESVLLEALFHAPVDAPVGDAAFVQVVRLTYPPARDVWLRPSSTSRLDYLDRGGLRLVPGATNGNPSSPPLVIAAGQIVTDYAPPGSPYWLVAHSVGPDPAALLEVSILTGPVSGERRDPDKHVLELSGGRMTLAPGATLVLPKLAGTVVLSVDEGTLDLTANEARMWSVRAGPSRSTRSDGNWSLVIPSTALGGGPHTEAHDYLQLRAGESALIAPADVVYWRNPGETPMTAMVITVITEADTICLGSPTCRTLFQWATTSERGPPVISPKF